MTITILTANLLTTKITGYLISFKADYKPLKFTLIAMGVITLIFYPLFSMLEEWLNKLSAKIVKSGSSAGGRYTGLFVMFFTCLTVLLYFFARMWYHIDLLHILFHGQIGNQF